jgi:hypothetical protein
MMFRSLADPSQMGAGFHGLLTTLYGVLLALILLRSAHLLTGRGPLR